MVFHQGERIWFWGCEVGAVSRSSLGLAKNLGWYVYCLLSGGSGGHCPDYFGQEEIRSNNSTRAFLGGGNGCFPTLGPAIVVLVCGVAIMKSMSVKMRGFTLMELLVVVAVMLILAVLGFSSYIFSIKKSHDVVRKSDLAAIAKGLETFANDFIVYPDDDGAGKIKACGSDVAPTACDWGDSMKISIGGNDQIYMVRIPKDPASNQSYYYKKTDDGFNLYAGLENISDPSYADVGISCGDDVNCNYTLTQAGVK